MNNANTTRDVDMDRAERIDILLECLTVLAKFKKLVTSLFEREAFLEALLRRWVRNSSLLFQSFVHGGQELRTVNGESVEVFNHTEWHQEAGLKSLGDLAVRNMRILDGELEAQMLIETVVVQIGPVPELGEGFEIFEGDQDAACSMVIGIRSSRSIDENPEVEISEDLGFLPSGHAWDFALTPDVFKSLGPRCGNLDEDVVLEDFLGFSINLVAGAEDS